MLFAWDRLRAFALDILIGDKVIDLKLQLLGSHPALLIVRGISSANEHVCGLVDADILCTTVAGARPKGA